MNRSTHAIAAAFFTLLLSLVLGGCSPFAMPGDVDDPLLFEVVGSVDVNVESFGGDVTIHATDNVTMARVTVSRESDHGYGRSSEGKESLAAIDYTVDVVNTETGPVLHIKTWSDDPESYLQRAHVRVEVPAVGDIMVRTERGNVEARMAQGTVDIQTTKGDVRVMTMRPMLDDVTIVNKDGDIDYRVRAESTGRFDCQTVDGRVLTKISHGRLIVHDGTSDEVLDATLNDGTNLITLRTVNGHIRVAVVENPLTVGLKIIDP